MNPTERRAAAVKKKGLWLAAILVLALVLRILYLLQARDHLFFNAFSDSIYYHRWALRILQGQQGPQVYYMSPLLPYVLALWYALLGPQVEIFLWFQVLLGTLGCLLLYRLGRRVSGISVGLLAAFMWAVYGPEIFYEGLLLMTTLLLLMHLLLLIAIYWAWYGRRLYRWAVCGLLLGLAAIGRANILTFLPLLLAGIFVLRPEGSAGRGRRLLTAAVILAGVLAVIVPVTMHNYLMGGDLVPITSNLGMNFFIGNHDRATGYYVKPKGLDLTDDIYGTKIANVHAGRGLKPSEVSRFWLDQGLDYVRTHPAAAAALFLRKVIFFWNAYEIPQVEDIYFLKRFVPLLRWPLLGFSLLGPLGLLGMILSLRHWRFFFILLAFVLAYLVSTAVFFVISRLRLQVCPSLMIFAAYALVWGREKWRRRGFRDLVWALAALAVLTLFVNWPLSSLDRPRQMAQAYRFYALHLRSMKQLQEAAGEYQKAIDIDPSLADTYVDLASLRLSQKESEAALELYQKALQVDPGVSGVHLNLGNAYASQGLWEKAIVEFRKETRNSPYSFLAYESLYRAMQERGQKSGEGGQGVDLPPSQN